MKTLQEIKQKHNLNYEWDSSQPQASLRQHLLDAFTLLMTTVFAALLAAAVVVG